jgi:trans-2,3-dihydro-3-hydroxyanthranilate isomerase
MRRPFATLDVFTDRRFAGNPLAVVLDAAGLDGDAMQAIAREFNLPETVFVLAPADTAHRARLRIFTPAAELPFAGHPTVGTAVLLGLRDGGADVRGMVLEEGIGPVRCRVEPFDGMRGRARFDVAQEPREIEPVDDLEAIAAALGLAADDIGCDGYKPSRWSAGVPFTFVPVRNRDAVGRSRPRPAAWDAAFGLDRPPGVYIFCREAVVPGHAFYARMYAPRMGITEDPATGSAVAALAGIAVRHGGLADGTHDLPVEQGHDMGRPSLINLSVTIQGGTYRAATIAGDAILVTEGTIDA